MAAALPRQQIARLEADLFDLDFLVTYFETVIIYRGFC